MEFPQKAEVTVVQGSTTSFTMSVEALGATACDATTAPVRIDMLYSVDAAGGITSALPGDMPIETAEPRGNSDNCSIKSPALVPLTATAAAETPVGEYTGVIRYGKGGDGDVDLDGPPLTIHVIAPDTQPAALPEPTLAPPEILVLGERQARPRPVLGKSVLLTLVRGKVTYRSPGRPTATLGSAVVVPNGTKVDASKGVVKVTVVRNKAGALDSADAWNGGFSARQSKSSRPVTTFTLTGAIVGPKRGASAAKRRAKRSLWVNGKGNFKTRGKRASAIVRGTTWLTEETTAGTRVSVKTGLVAVRDLVKRTTTVLGRNQSYLARLRSNVTRRIPAFTGSN